MIEIARIRNLLVYTRNMATCLNKLPMTNEELSLYNEEDSIGKYLLRSLRRTGGENRREDRPSMFFPVQDPEGSDVFPMAPEGWESRWVCSEDTYHELEARDEIVWKKVSKNGVERWQVYQKHYLGTEGKESSDLWNKIPGNKKATKDLNKLFDGTKVFDHPKPVEMICRAIMQGTSIRGSDIVLDFFAGSGSAGHAVFQQNVEDGGNRQFILVQLPEKLDEESNAYKLGFRSIAEVSKERIRRVARNFSLSRESQFDLEPHSASDLGFKVLKLNQSNFKLWQAPAKDISDEELLQQMDLNVDHIDPNASQEDLLYELLIKAGVMPIEKVEQIELASRKLFSVADGALLVHLEDDTDQALMDAVLAKAPGQFICLDKAFHGNDQLKTNAVKTFEAFNQGKEKIDQIDFKTV